MNNKSGTNTKSENTLFATLGSLVLKQVQLQHPKSIQTLLLCPKDSEISEN
jgi:hypothetical protein